MGLCVASMGLVGLGGLYFYFSGVMDDPDKIAKALEGTKFIMNYLSFFL